MAKYNINSPVQSNMFNGSKPKGTALPLHEYKGTAASVTSKAKGPGAHNSLNSPAPSDFLKGMPDDDRQFVNKSKD